MSPRIPVPTSAVVWEREAVGGASSSPSPSPLSTTSSSSSPISTTTPPSSPPLFPSSTTSSSPKSTTTPPSSSSSPSPKAARRARSALSRGVEPRGSWRPSPGRASTAVLAAAGLAWAWGWAWSSRRKPRGVLPAQGVAGPRNKPAPTIPPLLARAVSANRGAADVPAQPPKMVVDAVQRTWRAAKKSSALGGEALSTRVATAVGAIEPSLQPFLDSRRARAELLAVVSEVVEGLSNFPALAPRLGDLAEQAFGAGLSVRQMGAFSGGVVKAVEDALNGLSADDRRCWDSAAYAVAGVVLPELLPSDTVADFVLALSNTAAAPAGGPAGAIAGSMAAGLVAMAAGMAVEAAARGGGAGGGASEVERGQLEAALAEAQEGRDVLLALSQEDISAYSKVMTAVRCPPGAEGRGGMLAKSLAGASEVPMQVAERCIRVLRCALAVIQLVPKSAAGDVAAAVHLFQAAIDTSLQNVAINLQATKRAEERAGGGLSGCRDLPARMAEAAALRRELVPKLHEAVAERL